MSDKESTNPVPPEPGWRRLLRRHGVRFLTFFIASGGLWYGFNLWRITTFDWRTNGNADAALVLGGITRRGELSANFRERINHAIHLYREGRVRRLILTGGKPSWEPTTLAAAAAAYARSSGIPDKHLILESKSQTTIENFVYSKQLMDEYELTSCLIVSDPLHLCRATIIARDKGMNARPSGTPTTTITGRWKRVRFSLREAQLLSTYPVMRHAQGSKAYEITKRISTGFED